MNKTFPESQDTYLYNNVNFIFVYRRRFARACDGLIDLDIYTG